MAREEIRAALEANISSRRWEAFSIPVTCYQVGDLSIVRVGVELERRCSCCYRTVYLLEKRSPNEEKKNRCMVIFYFYSEWHNMKDLEMHHHRIDIAVFVTEEKGEDFLNFILCSPNFYVCP